MTIKVGDSVPQSSFTTSGPDGPKPLTTDVLFKGKTVALFAVPGAFTPTCSARHLPGYLDDAKKLKAKGIDLIACVSVNDVFVMDAWGKAQGVGSDILMLADGNGDFTKAVGLELDASRFGMGPRSQRYSMIVKDGTIKELNVEQGGEFRVSSAACSLKLGRCLAEQVGVKAPGTAKRATVLPLKSSSVGTGLGPSGPMVVNVAWGSLSPTLTAMDVSFALVRSHAGAPLH